VLMGLSEPAEVEITGALPVPQAAVPLGRWGARGPGGRGVPSWCVQICLTTLNTCMCCSMVLPAAGRDECTAKVLYVSGMATRHFSAAHSHALLLLACLL
jgi:hypothetical protein